MELDQLCFGGLWNLEGYQRELVSPNSDLLVLNLTCADFGLRNKAEQPTSPQTDENFNNSKSLVGLGCSWAILDEAHITLLAVHPDYRRAGLGLLLLTALMEVAQRRGMERATLEVRESNHAALPLYQKLGFKELGRRRRYYKDTDEDALILWRSGLQKSEFAESLEIWHKSACDRMARTGLQLIDVGINQQSALNKGELKSGTIEEKI